MRYRFQLVVVLLLLALSVPKPARAADPQLLGEGTWLVMGSSAGVLQYTRSNNIGALVFDLAATAGYFVADHIFLRLGIGGSAKVGSDLPALGGLTLSPGFGFHIPIGVHALLPAVAYVLNLGFQTQRQFIADGGFEGSRETATVVGHGFLLDLPFAASLAPHISLLIGPRLTFLDMPALPYAQTSAYPLLTVGMAAGVLGYF